MLRIRYSIHFYYSVVKSLQTTWHYRPIHVEVLKILTMKGGIARDQDVYEALRREYDISYTRFLKLLLTLELRGLIIVRQQREGVRIVELTPLGKKTQF